MITVEETRRIRLNMLVDTYDGMANLCEKIGLERTQTAGLTRIANANLRHDRNGEPYVMGSPMARDIENKLGLERGWMDTPPSIYDQDETANLLHEVMESLPKDQWPTALRLLSALKKPAANGTHG